MKSDAVMRGLMKVWMDFSTKLDNVPIIAKLQRGKFRVTDYKKLLINHRQQVVEGARWIACAASSVTSEYLELRSTFLRHAVTEHRDYRMLEAHYMSIGGSAEDIQRAERNIGTEALHGFMMHAASQPNPFNLLGAMFIIEGLGEKKAGEWGKAIKEQLELADNQVQFFLYHAENDEDHLQQFDDTLNSGILDMAGMGEAIVKTAAVVARLYRLQLEEIA